MSKVFFSVTMSLDGFLAPESRYDDVGDKRWFSLWMALQQYVFDQKFFQQNLKLGDGGRSLFDRLELQRAVSSPKVTHLFYGVKGR